MSPVVLFGAGSPIIGDIEESCARRGWTIEAVVRNVPGASYASGEAPILDVDPDMRLDQPVLLPLFSPANRRHAWRHGLQAEVRPTDPLPRRYRR